MSVDFFDKTKQAEQTHNDVFESLGDLFDAQNAATEALVAYNIATLNFYRDTGVLQVRNDGMWQY